MKAIGFEKAVHRFEQAQEHAKRLRELQSGINVPEFQDEWFNFLVDLQSVPEILKTSSKSSPQARQWVGSKEKNQIRKDPLLKYLHHARGADFHGLSVPTDLHADDGRYLGFQRNAGSITDQHGNTKVSGAIIIRGNMQVGESIKIEFRLFPVTDEVHGDTFDPPTEHLGKPLSDASPAGVAEAGLAYYADYLREASQFVR